MKYILSTLIIIVNVFCNCCSSETIEGRITRDSIDKAYLGMKINDLKRTYSNCDFAEIPLFEFGIDSENNGLLIKEKNKPIRINLENGHFNLIYYKDSIILTMLIFYPYVQLGIIILFIFEKFEESVQN